LVDDFEVRQAQAEAFPAGVDAGVLGAGQATGFRGGGAGVVGSVTDDGAKPVEGVGDDSFGGAGLEELDIRGGKTETFAGPTWMVAGGAVGAAGVAGVFVGVVGEDQEGLLWFEDYSASRRMDRNRFRGRRSDLYEDRSEA
jgi:hypothetical protein